MLNAPPIEFTDSHCHLNMIDSTSPEELVQTAQSQGVHHLLCVSVDLDTFPTVLAIAQNNPGVFASVGIHPNTPEKHTCDFNTLVDLAQQSSVVAIGETGLDYYRSQGPLNWQQQRFRLHIAAAKHTQKPLIIHNRQAAADTLDILRTEQASEIGGVMHCFVDDWETARQALDLGFYISFSGIVTFKNAQNLQAVAKKVPSDRLLIETDAPYLAPVPHRGKINQPAYVVHIAEFLANLRNESLEHLALATTTNFFQLFQTARTATMTHSPPHLPQPVHI